MNQLDHILLNIEAQNNMLQDINDRKEKFSHKYYLLRVGNIMNKIGYYGKLLREFGKRGLIIRITSEDYFKEGEVSILKPFEVYYNNINQQEALKLFQHEHPGKNIRGIQEITPGKLYGKKGKNSVAK
jgi:hypothetical protein